MRQPDNNNAPFGDIPALLWERWFLDECSPDELARINAQTTPKQREQVREHLAASNEQVLGLYPSVKVVEQIQWQLHRQQSQERHQRKTYRRYFWIALPAAAGFAAMLTLWVAMDPADLPAAKDENQSVSSYLGGQNVVATAPPATQDTPPNPSVATTPGTAAKEQDPGIRVKGDPRLLLYRQKGETVEELPDLSPANTGDRIQVEYIAAGKSHGVVLSVDGRENLTLHFPQSPNADTSLIQGDPQSLPHSYELDDAPAFETFYFVSANRPLNVGLVIQAFQAHLEGSPLTLDNDLMLYSITLKKPDLPENGDGNVN